MREARLSVVIPTLAAASVLPACIRSLAGLASEVVVSDGGSGDGTRRVAADLGARVVQAARGRGQQLQAGAAAASGEWLLFLHADTVLDRGAPRAAAAFMDEPSNAGRAGYFRFALDDPSPAARRLERLVALRCRWLGLPYGDQGLLIRRSLHTALGGFRPLPLMEDVDLARRIGRSRLVSLPADAVTSAARYRRDGYLRRSLRNAVCLAAWRMGLPPASLQRLYG